MGNLKNEHKKFGKAIWYSKQVEDIVDNLCVKEGINLKNGNRYLRFPEKISKLRIQNDVADIELLNIFNEILNWWGVRNKLMHDEKIAITENDEFKMFLKNGKFLIAKFVNKVPKLKGEKYEVIGRLVYMSTFVELHVNEKCQNRRISIVEDNQVRVPLIKKVNEILETNPKKVKKYEDIIEWWKRRNKLIHSTNELVKIEVSEIDHLIKDMNDWLGMSI